MFEALFVKPWPWWAAGPLIGLYAVAFFAFARRKLGASSSFPAALEALRGQDDAERMDLTRADDPLLLPKEPRDPAPRWRLWWLGGLLLAGILAAVLEWAVSGKAPEGDAHLPGFVKTFGLSDTPQGWAAELGLLALGGVLIGFGTRMSGGCTSGHAIFGISQRQLPSLWATCVFFGAGMALSFLLQALLGGAQ